MLEGAIVSVLSELGILNRERLVLGGQWVQSPCPFARYTHSRGIDRKPSFGIKVNNTGMSRYNCFSCGRSGQLFELPDALAKLAGDPQGDYEGMSKVLDAELNSLKGVDIGSVPFLDAVGAQDEPLSPLLIHGFYDPIESSPDACAYVHARGVGLDALHLLGVQYDTEESRLMFPIMDAGGLLYGFTGRSILSQATIDISFGYPKVKNYWCTKSRHLLGAQLISKKKPTIVVEGLFALARFLSFPSIVEKYNVVAVMGSSVSQRQLDLLIETGTSIYLMLDGDMAGQQGIYGIGTKPGALYRLKPHCIVFTPKYPEGIFDPDELDEKTLAQILTDCYPST